MALPLEIREKFGHSFTEFLASSGEPDFLDKLGIKREPESTPESAEEGGNAE